MKTTSGKKISVYTDTKEEQENVKNTRKTLQILQQVADKENLVGRSIVEAKLGSEKPSINTKISKKLNVGVQTNDKGSENKSTQTECTITADDLTAEECSIDYWKLLAEKRAEFLTESQKEKERLKEHVDALKEENRICKEMLEESKCLVKVLQEMLEEPQAGSDQEEI